MRRTFTSSIQTLLALTVLAMAGCSAEADFCKKLQEFDPEGQKDCKTDAVPEVKKNCENAEEVFSCVAKAADKKAADGCSKVCKKKETKDKK